MSCIWNCKVEDRHCEWCAFPNCGERVVEGEPSMERYIPAMISATGIDPTERSRRSEVVWARNIVAYQMSLDGFRSAYIGSVLGVNRTSVLHAMHRMRDMKTNPKFYPAEIEMWRKFQKELSLHKTITV